jgi:hypothetical protein
MSDMRQGEDGPATVYVIFGRAGLESLGTPEEEVEVNILLMAPDEDSAVRRALEALAGEGYVTADLDRIGVLLEEPDDPTYESAWQDALAGEVAVISIRR